MNRRDFLPTTMMTGTALSLAPRATTAADARIDVLVDEPIARIDPNVDGHFVEHPGGVVSDGIWVGEGSRIADMGGIRQAIVDHMRRLPPTVYRWPGGCLADSYDWRDAWARATGGRAGRASGPMAWARDRTARGSTTRTTDPCDATIAVRGRAASARATVIAASDIHAHHTFDRPSTVAPASITRLSIALG